MKKQINFRKLVDVRKGWFYLTQMQQGSQSKESDVFIQL